jgi:hypothetical protein
MNTRHFFCAVVAFGLPGLAGAQELRSMIVLDANTACRAQPDTNASIARSFALGSQIYVTRDTVSLGMSWVVPEEDGDSHLTCWIERTHTEPFDQNIPEAPLIDLTARLVQKGRRASFEEFVAAENLLLGPYVATLKTSPLLQYRRLLIVEEAGRRVDKRADQPLYMAWFLAHSDLLAESPFSSSVIPLAKPFWKLYAGNPTAPWADDLAWHAAQITRPTDECYSDCVLHEKIMDGPMQYWRRLPHGNAIGAAIKDGADMAKYAASMACYDRKDRLAYTESPVPPQYLREIRASLSRVTIPEKRQLLEQLSVAEAKCR